MEKKDSLINLTSYKQKKQLQAEMHAYELYQQSLAYLERETNIREKVRAKFLFSKKFSLSLEGVSAGSQLDYLFRQWLLFDYKTIERKTVFHQFLNANADNITETGRMLGAMFLTAAWDAVEVLENDSDEKSLIVQNILHKHIEEVLDPSKGTSLKVGDLIFIRKVPLVTKGMLIGPPFRVKDGEIFNSLLDDYQSMSNDSGMTWRSFSKEFAAKFIAQSI
ncbi:hypothetical protein [Bacillus sp. AK031]